MDEHEKMMYEFHDVYGDPASPHDPEYLIAVALFTKGWQAGKSFQQNVQRTAGNGWQKFIRWLCGLFTPRR
jgi:hypothetical protein